MTCPLGTRLQYNNSRAAQFETDPSPADVQLIQPMASESNE